MTRLCTKDWDTLDEIIGKMTFGGYYDLLDFLKLTIKDLIIALGKEQQELLKTLEQEQELDVLIHLLHKLVYLMFDKLKE